MSLTTLTDAAECDLWRSVLVAAVSRDSSDPVADADLAVAEYRRRLRDEGWLEPDEDEDQ